MVVWPVVLHTTVMIVFWLMSVTCSGSCPENSALREALTCLHNLTDGDNAKISISPADIKQTKSFCENGNFQDSVRCLRGLHNTCRDPVKLEMLKKYADPDAWEAGFNRLCHSMSLYTTQGECIIKQNEAIQKCVESKKNIEVSSRAGVSYNFNEYEKEYVENVCGYFQILNYCYSNQIGTQCGAGIQAVLSDFNSGLTPPICRDFSFAALHSPGSVPDRSSVTLFACVMTFLAAWMTPS